MDKTVLCSAHRAALLILMIVVNLEPQPLVAQVETVVVVPGPDYAETERQQRLFGKDYRDLWTTPIAVGVFDMDSIPGLHPLRRGGGRQTSSLRFADREGREYSFRSIDKRPDFAVHPDLRGALASRLLQDQVSSLVPGAPVVAARLAEAVGILHPGPRIVVLPDDPRLGEFREEFAGMLGTFEQHVDEAEDGGPGFGGFTTIAATETVLEHLEEDPGHRVDDRAYLAARLLDLVMGDWDRHEDQWRWIRRDIEDGFVWSPVPRDRDYALANYDGAGMRVLRRFVPNAVRFDEEITDLDGLLLNARPLDRQLLAALDWATWSSVADEITKQLTDEKIEAAVRALPQEFVALRGDELVAKLRSRRDHLPAAAQAFYRIIADVPEIVATDADETAEILRKADGSVAVQIRGATGTPHYQRSFAPAHTREIRLYLKGGDDSAIITGSGASPITIRLIGGGGTDRLVDSSSVALPGAWSSLHDEDNDSDIIGGAQAIRVRSEYMEPPTDGQGLIRVPVDDHPDFSISFRPDGDYSSTTGIMVGGQVSFTERGFRRHPFAARTKVEALYAPRWSSFGVEVETEMRGYDPARHATLAITASGIDALRFYGFGNESVEELASSTYRLRRDLYQFDVVGHQRLGGSGNLSLGLVARHSLPHAVRGSPLEITSPLGSAAFTSLGARAALHLERGSVDSADVVVESRVEAAAHPIVSRGGGEYARLSAVTGASLAVGTLPLRAVLRAGGAYAWGDYPFFEAAILGGGETLRGFPSWRFAGDAAAFTSAELVAPLARLPLIMNWRVSGHAFMDVGRVFMEGEDSRTWHSAPGVGLSFSALNYHANVSYAHGSKGRFYLSIGVPPGDPRVN